MTEHIELPDQAARSLMLAGFWPGALDELSPTARAAMIPLLPGMSEEDAAPDVVPRAPGVAAGSLATLNTAVYEQWLEARGSHRQTLFGTEQLAVTEGEDLSAIVMPSLSAIALGVGGMSGAEAVRHDRHVFLRSHLRSAVGAILVRHDLLAHNSEEPSAIFGLVAPDKDLPSIRAFTEQVIWHWERRLSHANRQKGPDEWYRSPFHDLPATDEADFSRQDVQLVVETAAAVCEVRAIGFGNGKSPTTSGGKNLVRLIAERGPDWAMAWIRGDIIREHCQESGQDADKLLALVPRSYFADAALSNTRDPTSVIERLVNKYEVLEDVYFSDIPGADEAVIDSLLSRTSRLRLARSADPVELARNLVVLTGKEGELGIDKLSRRLGWSRRRTREFFPAYERLKLARDYRDAIPEVERRAQLLADPALTPHALADVLGWSEAEVAALFSPSLMRYITNRPQIEPQTEIRRIAWNYDKVLSPANLGPALSRGKRQIIRYFPDYTRKQLARKRYPILAAGTIATTIDELIPIVAQEGARTSKIAIFIAHRWSGDVERARAVAQKVRAEQDNCPRYISKTLWASVVARLPDSPREIWQQRVAAYKTWLRTKDVPLAFDAPLPGMDYGERYGVTPAREPVASDPADLVLGEDAPEIPSLLRELASEAAVSSAQLHELLDFVGRGGDADRLPEGDERRAILERLRKAGGGAFL